MQTAVGWGGQWELIFPNSLYEGNNSFFQRFQLFLTIYVFKKIWFWWPNELQNSFGEKINHTHTFYIQIQRGFSCHSKSFVNCMSKVNLRTRQIIQGLGGVGLACGQSWFNPWNHIVSQVPLGTTPNIKIALQNKYEVNLGFQTQ